MWMMEGHRLIASASGQALGALGFIDPTLLEEEQPPMDFKVTFDMLACVGKAIQQFNLANLHAKQGQNYPLTKLVQKTSDVHRKLSQAMGHRKGTANAHFRMMVELLGDTQTLAREAYVGDAPGEPAPR